MVPASAEPPVVPLTLHVTAVFVVFNRVAANCWLCVVTTLAVIGLTVTETGGNVIVTVAEALLVESAELIAVIVTVSGLGTEDGAV
jgi:hypothetical protein